MATFTLISYLVQLVSCDYIIYVIILWQDISVANTNNCGKKDYPYNWHKEFHSDQRGFGTSVPTTLVKNMLFTTILPSLIFITLYNRGKKIMRRNTLTALFYISIHTKQTLPRTQIHMWYNFLQIFTGSKILCTCDMLNNLILLKE